MTGSEQSRGSAIARLATVAGLFILLVTASAAQAQTFTVLHTFSGGDGANPVAGVTLDRQGNLYGTTEYGGAANNGTVFKLSRSGSSWVLAPLYAFTGGTDGGRPQDAVVFGPNGTLYGTTFVGGNDNDGVVFNLHPQPTRPPAVLSPWVETVIHSFAFWNDGAWPFSEVTFDAAGNLYGTTYAGGDNGDDERVPGGGEACYEHCGVVYELSPSNGGWNETTIFFFTAGTGANPTAGLAFDSAGNLDGVTAAAAAAGLGAFYQLMPSASGWTERTVHAILWTDGKYSAATPLVDSSGNLYAGMNGYSGYYGTYDGNVSHVTTANGQLTPLYSFPPANGPYGGLAMDAAGILYGTTNQGGAFNNGVIFELTPMGSGWIYTDLHDFATDDGCQSMGKVALDAGGNLYGTTSSCGANNDGTVWELTP